MSRSGLGRLATSLQMSRGGCQASESEGKARSTFLLMWKARRWAGLGGHSTAQVLDRPHPWVTTCNEMAYDPIYHGTSSYRITCYVFTCSPAMGYLPLGHPPRKTSIGVLFNLDAF